MRFPENDGGKSVIYSQEVIQGEVLKFIEQQQENPFFLFVPMVLPHAELVVPEDSIIQKFRGRFPETPYVGVDAKTAFEKGGYRSQEHPRATHAAMVTHIDLYVGQIIDKLKETGVLENTLIVFTSDNGPHREGVATPIISTATGYTGGTSGICTRGRSVFPP